MIDFNETYGLDHPIKMTEGGQRLVIEIGNTVIDIMHGYNNSHDIPCAIVETYAYDNKQHNRLLIRDEQKVVLSK